MGCGFQSPHQGFIGTTVNGMRRRAAFFEVERAGHDCGTQLVRQLVVADVGLWCMIDLRGWHSTV